MMRFILAVVASFTAMFLLAGLFTSVLVRSFIVEHVDAGLLRSPPNLALIAFGYFALAALMAIIYARIIAPTATPLRSGVGLGVAAAICWLMPYSLVLFGAYNFPYAALPIDFGWALLEQGVGGALIGLIYGKAGRERPAKNIA